MKIYFAGAIRGGRSKIDDYAKIINKLQEKGEVLTTHVADPNLSENGEKDLTQEDIYYRDVRWLNQADVLVAEISIPSLGIGYEIAYSENKGTKIICFYDNKSEKALSAMIGGNKNVEVVRYNDLEEVINYIDKNL